LHEPGEVGLPRLALLGRVGARDVAELALVALVDDAAVLVVGQERHVARAVVAPVYHREEILERRAELHADPAVGADLEGAISLGARVAGVVVVGAERIVEVLCRGHGGLPGRTITAPGTR